MYQATLAHGLCQISTTKQSRLVRSLFEVREELVFGLSGLCHALLATQPLGPMALKDDLKGPYGRSENVNVNATDSMLPPRSWQIHVGSNAS